MTYNVLSILWQLARIWSLVAYCQGTQSRFSNRYPSTFSPLRKSPPSPRNRVPVLLLGFGVWECEKEAVCRYGWVGFRACGGMGMVSCLVTLRHEPVINMIREGKGRRTCQIRWVIPCANNSPLCTPWIVDMGIGFSLSSTPSRFPSFHSPRGHAH